MLPIAYCSSAKLLLLMRLPACVSAILRRPPRAPPLEAARSGAPSMVEPWYVGRLVFVKAVSIALGGVSGISLIPPIPHCELLHSSLHLPQARRLRLSLLGRSDTRKTGLGCQRYHLRYIVNDFGQILTYVMLCMFCY